jgi:hypothetical protein
MTFLTRAPWSDQGILIDMPLRQSSKTLTQRVDCQLFSVVNEVLSNVLAGGRQKTTPLNFVVPDGGLVCHAGIVTRSCMEVVIDFAHATHPQILRLLGKFGPHQILRQF